ncbi:unnamed protein product [Cochlearia groenlandica]
MRLNFRGKAWMFLGILCCSWLVCVVKATVTYDHKAVIINGQRRILFSGSIHYPRSTPEMWPDLIQKAKEGGLDVIQTYVFWNGHEPSPGNYYFEDRYDLVKFVKIVQQAGLYVNLRIGPYVCAEWNFGGFPVWLKYVPGMAFRTDNEPFKIENEYGPIEWEIGAQGKAYTQWAAKMAQGLSIGVPWIMCKQDDAPNSIINTCNGFYCENFKPNSDNKPKMWTENWTGWFTEFGGAVPYRPAEDIAFSVARFIQNGGSFMNYYMYHGGTNFDRTAGEFIATSYDYDAPLDEYGLPREPKYSHLKMLHKVIKLCEQALISSDDIVTSLGDKQEAHVFKSKSSCAAFLSNYNASYAARVLFNGSTYDLPPWSVSILPNCKTEYYNTAKVNQTCCIQTAYGTLENPKLTFSQKIKLHQGVNKLALLSIAAGLPVRVLGPVTLEGVNSGMWDMSKWKWSYKIGSKGESLSLHTLAGASTVEWKEGSLVAKKQPLTWYKSTFETPKGNEPLALDMNTMGKGQVWINGNNIGRHWPAYKARGSCGRCSYAGTYTEKKCLSNCGEASQRW